LVKKQFYLLILCFILIITLFISIIVLGIISDISHLPLIPIQYIFDFIKILPGPIYTDIFLLFFISIGFYFLNHLLYPYYIKIWYYFHKIYRRKSKYGFMVIGKKVSFYKLFIRAFYMGLFAFSITTLISSFSGNYFFRAGLPLPGLSALFVCEDIFLGTFLICPITILIFFPIFQMEDSGFITYRHLPNYMRTPEIEGVHALLYRLLKGYSGLSTIITLIYYIYAAFEAVDWNFGNPAILTPLILIGLPFLMIGLLFIPFLLYDKCIEKNSERLRKKFKKLPSVIVPNFDDIISK